MKHLIAYIAATIASFISVQLSAQPARGGYHIDRMNQTVYFCDTPISDADIRTFRDLGYGYAKDNRHVYLYGEILLYVDPATFRVSRQYGPDGGHNHRPGDDYPYPDTRKRGYLISNFDVFYNGKKVEDASAQSFEVLKDGYAKDAFNVYWNGKKIQDASSHSFEVLRDGYAKDAFNTYYLGKRID